MKHRRKRKKKMMSTQQRDLLAKWLPVVIALLTNAMVVAYGYGRLEQRLNPIEQSIASLAYDKLSGSFVTRTEFNTRTTQRDREMGVQNAWLARIEDKLDRLLERQRMVGD